MKKNVLFVAGLTSSIFALGQNTENLIKEFGTQNEKNQEKFEQTLLKNTAKTDAEAVKDEQSRLAGFAGEIPVFLQTDDTRANRSANVVALQQGTLSGLNNTPIQGSGMNILVMDGGKIFDKHNEFGASEGVITTQRIFDKENGTVAYANHATNVAGIIGAIGVGSFSAPYGANAARGVLTKVNFDSYSFSSTALGTNYQKLAAATTANVSNHSYGVNLGWVRITAGNTTTTYPNVGYYWVADYTLNAEDTYSGSYGTNDANFDAIVYDNPNQIVVKSSGNYYGIGPGSSDAKFKWSGSQGKYVPFEDGDVIPAANCSQGYYCIGWGSLAKNVIVVGATDQLTTANNIYTTSTDVVKASYSSAGPRRDGAIKPDVSAVGSNHLVAGYTNSTTYNTYYTGNGTSYAAPIVSGIAGAVTEINRNITGNSSFTYKSNEMKALLTHTANEAGNPGPDVWFGWGFVDATKAAQLVIAKNQNKAIFERNTLSSGVVYSKEVEALNGTPLKATISWVDPAAVPFTSSNDYQNNHSSKIINDLDLRIIDTVDNTIYYPWKLDVSNPRANATKGDNLVDNVEQVLIDAPVAGRKYRIEVSNKGTLVNDGGNAANQDYAVIITGYDTATLAVTDLSLQAVSVYPTKTKDIVNVVIPEGSKTISVYDMAGKQVLSVNAKSYQTVDLSKLPNGIYLFNIVTEKGKISKKVIKE